MQGLLLQTVINEFVFKSRLTAICQLQKDKQVKFLLVTFLIHKERTFLIYQEEKYFDASNKGLFFIH